MTNNYYHKYIKYKTKYILLANKQCGGQDEEKKIKIKLKPYFILDDSDYTDDVETGNTELNDVLNFKFSDDTLNLQGFLNNMYKVVDYEFDINSGLLYVSLEKQEGSKFTEKDFMQIRRLFDPYNTEENAWMQWDILILTTDEFKQSEIYKGNHKVELGFNVLNVDFV